MGRIESGDIDDKTNRGKVKLVFSVELLDEFLTVADRPKFRRLFNKTDLEQLLALFDFYEEVIEVSSKVTMYAPCRVLAVEINT